MIEEKVINGIKGEWLELKNIFLKEIPKNYTFNHSVSLDGSVIKALPPHTIIKGNLYIGDADIEELPEGLIVGGYLDLRNSKVKKLGQNTVAYQILKNKTVDNTFYRVYYSKKPNIKPGVYPKYVVTNDKEVIPYSNFKKVSFHNYGKDDKRAPLEYILYRSLDGSCHVISYDKQYIKCIDTHAGTQEIERYRLKHRDTSKFDAWKLKEEHTVEELRECYECITDSCGLGIDNFIKNAVPDINALYTLDWLREHTKIYDKETAHWDYLFQEWCSNKEGK